MYATGNKKMLIMLILEILKEHSDSEHRLTQQEIIRLLDANYGMECDRRSVKANILSLIELDYDISMENGYYLAEREFEDAELRLLIDSVFSSRVISQAQAKRLIDKLQAQGNRYFKPKISHVCMLPQITHSDNKQVMLTLDVLNDAIEAQKKVAFVYNSYGQDGRLHPRQEDDYVVSPYQLAVSNGRYYLISHYEKYDGVIHFRVDKITGCRMLEEPVKPQKEVKGLEHGLDLPRHLAEHIYFFSGQSVPVLLEAWIGAMDDIIDWFGQDYQIISCNGDMMRVRVNCNESAMLYWALQYGQRVEVLEPLSLREEIAAEVEKIHAKYRKKEAPRKEYEEIHNRTADTI